MEMWVALTMQITKSKITKSKIIQPPNPHVCQKTYPMLEYTPLSWVRGGTWKALRVAAAQSRRFCTYLLDDCSPFPLI